MLREYLSNIADKFRTYLDTTEPINAQDFAGKVEDVAVRYNQLGFTNGREVGYNQGLEEGIEQGKQAEYDAFWDKFQDNGKRTDYCYAFATVGKNGVCAPYSFWDKFLKINKPKYPIRPTALEYGFKYFGAVDYSADGIDWYDFFKDIDIDLNSVEMSASSTFYGSAFKTLPKMCVYALNNTFSGCKKLVSIEEINTDTANNVFEMTTQNAFFGCSELKEVRFGCFLKSTFNFSSCTKLSYESLTNIKEQLVDISGGSTSKTITFGPTNLAKFTADDLAEIEAKGWTVK